MAVGGDNDGHRSAILAPGLDVLTTVPHQAYDFMTGSSFATPHVAGITALLLQLHPDWQVADIKRTWVTIASCFRRYKPNSNPTKNPLIEDYLTDVTQTHDKKASSTKDTKSTKKNVQERHRQSLSSLMPVLSIAEGGAVAHIANLGVKLLKIRNRWSGHSSRP